MGLIYLMTVFVFYKDTLRGEIMMCYMVVSALSKTLDYSGLTDEIKSCFE